MSVRLRVWPLALAVWGSAVNCVGDRPEFTDADASGNPSTDHTIAGNVGTVTIQQAGVGGVPSVALEPSVAGFPVTRTSTVGAAGAPAQITEEKKEGRCDTRQPFGTVQPVSELNTAANEDAPRLTPDQLTIYFTRQTPNGPFQVFSARRAQLSASFGDALALPLHPDSSGPALSGNGSRLYYCSDLADASLSPDLYVTSIPFSAETSLPLTLLNSPGWEFAPFVSADDQELYYVVRPNQQATDDIWFATKQGDSFGAPQELQALNLPDINDRSPVISSDGLSLYFGSDRPASVGNATGQMDIFVATRKSRAEPFASVLRVSELNSAANEQPDWISRDDCVMYFRSDRPGVVGGRDIWMAVRSQP